MLVWQHDNVRAANVSATSTTSGLPVTPVLSKSTAYTVVIGDKGKVVNGNPTGGTFTVSLLSAITAGDGFRIAVRHVGTAGQVTLQAASSQTISFAGKALTVFALAAYGESVWLVSDGANWHVDSYAPPLLRGALPFFVVEDRQTAPPASPTAGSRYLINGTPTGTWLTLGFAANQIAEADGNGSWFSFTPAAGWFAYLKTSSVYTSYGGAAWVDQSGMAAPSTSFLKQFVVRNEQTDGTGGGTATAGSWGAIPLNATSAVPNAISGATLASNNITLPTGTYLIIALAPFHYTLVSRARLRSTTGSAVYYSDTVRAGMVATGPISINLTATAMLITPHKVTAASETFAFEYFVNQTEASDGLGFPSTSTGVAEDYAQVTVIDLSALQGPAGPAGTDSIGGMLYLHATYEGAA